MDKEKIREFLIEEANKVEDPINWIYMVEEVLVSLQENFSWITLEKDGE